MVLTQNPGRLGDLLELRDTAQREMARNRNTMSVYIHAVTDLLLTRQGLKREDAEGAISSIYDPGMSLNRTVFARVWELVERVNGER